MKYMQGCIQDLSGEGAFVGGGGRGEEPSHQ